MARTLWIRNSVILFSLMTGAYSHPASGATATPQKDQAWVAEPSLLMRARTEVQIRKLKTLVVKEADGHEARIKEIQRLQRAQNPNEISSRKKLFP